MKIREFKKPSTFNFQFSTRKGFTLVELLVVMAIIGVLATMAFGILNVGGQLKKSRDARRKTDLQQIRNALEAYYNDNGNYPNYPSGSAVDSRSAQPWIPGLTSSYTQTLPIDPKNSSSPPYFYQYIQCPPAPDPRPSNYILGAHLEYAQDPLAGISVNTGLPGNCSYQLAEWMFFTNP